MEIFSDYDLGSKLNFHYQNAKPFPNIIIDNFINPGVAMQCFKELKQTNYWVTEHTENNAYMTDNQVINGSLLGMNKVLSNSDMKYPQYLMY